MIGINNILKGKLPHLKAFWKSKYEMRQINVLFIKNTYILCYNNLLLLFL